MYIMKWIMAREVTDSASCSEHPTWACSDSKFDVPYQSKIEYSYKYLGAPVWSRIMLLIFIYTWMQYLAGFCCL